MQSNPSVASLVIFIFSQSFMHVSTTLILTTIFFSNCLYLIFTKVFSLNFIKNNISLFSHTYFISLQKFKLNKAIRIQARKKY